MILFLLFLLLVQSIPSHGIPKIKESLVSFVRTTPENDQNTCFYSNMLFFGTEWIGFYDGDESQYGILLDILKSKACFEEKVFNHDELTFSDLNNAVTLFDKFFIKNLLDSFNTQQLMFHTQKLYELVNYFFAKAQKIEASAPSFKTIMQIFLYAPKKCVSQQVEKTRKAIANYLNLKASNPDCSILENILKNPQNTANLDLSSFSSDFIYYCIEKLGITLSYDIKISWEHQGNQGEIEINGKHKAKAATQASLHFADLILQFASEFEQLDPEISPIAKYERRKLNVITIKGDVIPAYFNDVEKRYIGLSVSSPNFFERMKGAVGITKGVHVEEEEKIIFDHIWKVLRNFNPESAFKSLGNVILEQALHSNTHVTDLELGKQMVLFLKSNGATHLFNNDFWESKPRSLLNAILWYESQKPKYDTNEPSFLQVTINLFKELQQTYQETQRFTPMSLRFLEFLQFQYFLRFHIANNENPFIAEQQQKFQIFLKDFDAFNFALRFEEKWKNKYKVSFFGSLITRMGFSISDLLRYESLRRIVMRAQEDDLFWQKVEELLEFNDNVQIPEVHQIPEVQQGVSTEQVNVDDWTHEFDLNLLEDSIPQVSNMDSAIMDFQQSVCDEGAYMDSEELGMSMEELDSLDNFLSF